MDVTPHEEPVPPDDEALAGPAGRELVGRVVAEAFGEEAARRFNQVWRALDEMHDRDHPGEGLRERKKRLTRQRISDVATALFAARGFDNVRVAEIADRVGVSEKTIYNYFPTKESLVFDMADEQLERLAGAIRERPPGTTPTAAFVAALKADMAQFVEALGETNLDFLPAFGEMIRNTPALRAAWAEHRHRTAARLTEVLAGELGVDPRDPEAIVAARAIVSLLELYNDSQLRRIYDGTDMRALQRAIEADLDRGARLLDTGLWSLQAMIEGRRTQDQLREAARAAEQARQQVLIAVREAKRAWRELRAARARVGS